MTDYGVGGAVLGLATVLPATGAIAMSFTDKTNLFVIYGLIAITTVSLLLNIATVVRYVINSTK